MKAVLLPPEERQHVKSAIAAARAEEASERNKSLGLAFEAEVMRAAAKAVAQRASFLATCTIRPKIAKAHTITALDGKSLVADKARPTM